MTAELLSQLRAGAPHPTPSCLEELMSAPSKLPRGVSLYRGRYRVRIIHEGRTVAFGMFDTLTDARAALSIARADARTQVLRLPAQHRAARQAEAERAVDTWRRPAGPPCGRSRARPLPHGPWWRGTGAGTSQGTPRPPVKPAATCRRLAWSSARCGCGIRSAPFGRWWDRCRPHPAENRPDVHQGCRTHRS